MLPQQPVSCVVDLRGDTFSGFWVSLTHTHTLAHITTSDKKVSLKLFVCRSCAKMSQICPSKSRRVSEKLTVRPESQRRWRAQDPGVRHRVLHQADVAPHVGRLHLGDVKVPRVLGNEAAAVLGDEGGELVEHPAVDDLWRDEARRTLRLRQTVIAVAKRRRRATADTLAEADRGTSIRLCH